MKASRNIREQSRPDGLHSAHHARRTRSCCRQGHVHYFGGQTRSNALQQDGSLRPPPPNSAAVPHQAVLRRPNRMGRQLSINLITPLAIRRSHPPS
eukprot:1071994-Alexandrium_andersonii.AAC.1